MASRCAARRRHAYICLSMQGVALNSAHCEVESLPLSLSLALSLSLSRVSRPIQCQHVEQAAVQAGRGEKTACAVLRLCLAAESRFLFAHLFTPHCPALTCSTPTNIRFKECHEECRELCSRFLSLVSFFFNHHDSFLLFVPSLSHWCSSSRSLSCGS